MWNNLENVGRTTRGARRETATMATEATELVRTRDDAVADSLNEMVQEHQLMLERMASAEARLEVREYGDQAIATALKFAEVALSEATCRDVPGAAYALDVVHSTRAIYFPEGR